MIRHKGIYLDWRGVKHSVDHGVGTMLIVALFGFNTGAVILATLIDTMAHYHIDWAKSQLNQWLDLKPDQEKFWWLLGLDQLLHYLTYIVILYFILY